MDEILALHVAILSFAWRKASEKGIVDPKYRDTVTAAVAGEAEGRLKKYVGSIDAYNRAIERSPDLDTADTIRAVNSEFISRIGFTSGEEEWKRRLWSEFWALYDSMLDGPVPKGALDLGHEDDIDEVAEEALVDPERLVQLLNDQALIKQVYLAVEEAAKKWTFRHRDWAMIYSQLMIYFGDRLGERA